MGWTFGLPAYATDSVVQKDDVKATLSRLGFDRFKHAQTYGELIRDLLQGRCHAAWATPVVCATVEGAGGRVLIQATRQGARSYRSVLFARKDRRASMDALKGLIAAWPDAQSMSGYVLPRTMLFAVGSDPSTTLHKETFLGSFKACVDAVLDKRADVSATDASATDALPHVDGYVALAGARAGELMSLGYTPDCPHGGIVLSPANKPNVTAKIEDHVLALMKEPETLAMVARTLGVDGFTVPPLNTYGALREFLSAPTQKLHVKLT